MAFPIPFSIMVLRITRTTRIDKTANKQNQAGPLISDEEDEGAVGPEHLWLLASVL